MKEWTTNILLGILAVLGTAALNVYHSTQENLMLFLDGARDEVRNRLAAEEAKTSAMQADDRVQNARIDALEKLLDQHFEREHNPPPSRKP